MSSRCHRLLIYDVKRIAKIGGMVLRDRKKRGFNSILTHFYDNYKKSLNKYLNIKKC